MRRDDTTLAGLNFHLALSPCVPLVRVDLARCVRGALGGQPIPRLPLDGGDDSGCCSEGEVGCSCGPDPLGGLAASGESVGSGVAPAQAHWAGPFDQMPVHAVPAQMHYGSGRAAKPLPAAGGVPGASPIAPCTYEVQPEGTLAPDQPWVPTPDGVEPPRVDPCVVDCGSEPPPMPGHDVVMGEDCEWEQVPSDDGAPPHPYGPLQPSGPSGASGPVQSSGGSAGGRPAAGAAYDVVAKKAGEGYPGTGGATTGGPTTSGPTTSGPTTSGPTTSGPTASGPTTGGPTTSGPTTSGPTVGGPTTGGSGVGDPESSGTFAVFAPPGGRRSALIQPLQDPEQGKENLLCCDWKSMIKMSIRELRKCLEDQLKRLAAERDSPRGRLAALLDKSIADGKAKIDNVVAVINMYGHGLSSGNLPRWSERAWDRKLDNLTRFWRHEVNKLRAVNESIWESVDPFMSLSPGALISAGAGSLTKLVGMSKFLRLGSLMTSYQKYKKIKGNYDKISSAGSKREVFLAEADMLAELDAAFQKGFDSLAKLALEGVFADGEVAHKSLLVEREISRVQSVRAVLAMNDLLKKMFKDRHNMGMLSFRESCVRRLDYLLTGGPFVETVDGPAYPAKPPAFLRPKLW